MFGKKVFVDVIKDLEMRRSSRVISVAPQIQETQRQKRREQCDKRTRQE